MSKNQNKQLSTFSNEELVQELSKRGYSVMPPFEPLEPMEIPEMDWVKPMPFEEVEEYLQPLLFGAVA